MKHLLILISFLLLSSPLFGQSSKCTRVQIGEMIKKGLSESEILEVCRKPTQSFEEKITEKPSKPEEDKPKVPLKYSDKLGVRSNEGSLTTKHLNPPKNTNTRFYFLYSQIVNSEENRKLSSLIHFRYF